MSRRAFLGGAAGAGAFVALGPLGGARWLGQAIVPVAGAQSAPELSVRLIGRQAAIDLFRQAEAEPNKLASGELLERCGIDEVFPAGMMMGWAGVAPADGSLFVGVVPQSGTVASGGVKQSVAIFDVGEDPSMTIRDLPTKLAGSAGFEKVHNLRPAAGSNPITFDPFFGGADISDVTIIPGTTDTVVLNSVTPVGVWATADHGSSEATLQGKGVFHTFAVLKKTGSEWNLDTTRSMTGDDLYNSYNDSEVFPLRPTSWVPGDVPVRGSLGVTETDTFDNGHVVASQYYPSAGSGAAVFVTNFDVASSTPTPRVVASYKFPDFYDVRGKAPGTAGALPVGWACRSVMVDPTATNPADYRFFVLPDVTPAPARKITSVYRSGDLVVFDTAPLGTDPQSAHSYGPGQFPKITGLSGVVSGVDLSTFNTPANYSAIIPIFDTPTASSFSIFAPGSPFTSGTLTGAQVRLRQGAPCIEMRYDSVAGTITPVSKPCHLDENQTAIGTVIFDADGNMFLNPIGTQGFMMGALSIWRKRVFGRRSLVEIAPAPRDPGNPDEIDVDAFAHSWGTIVPADHAFGATAGLGSIQGGMVFDSDDSTAYWTSGDNVRRVKVTDDFVVDKITRSEQFNVGGRAVATYAALATVASNPHSAPYTLKVTAGGGGAPSCRLVERFTATAQHQYEVSAWVRLDPGVVGVARLHVEWHAEDGTVLGAPVGDNAVVGQTWNGTAWVPNSNWVLLSATFNAPLHSSANPQVATGTVQVAFDQLTAGQSFYVDDITFVDENRAKNPGFELAPASDIPTWAPLVAGSCTVTRRTTSMTPPATVRVGTASLEVKAATSPTAGPGAISSEAIPVEVDRSYMVAGWVKMAAGKGRVAIGVRWLSATNTEVTTAFGPSVIVDDITWVKVRASLGAPAHPPGFTSPAAAKAKIVITSERFGPGDASFIVDDVTFVKAPGTDLPDIQLELTKLPRGGLHQTKDEDPPSTGLPDGPPTKNGGLMTTTRPVIARISATDRKLYIPIAQYGRPDRATDIEDGTVPYSRPGAADIYPAAVQGVTAHTGTKVLSVTNGSGGPACTSTETLVMAPPGSYLLKAWVLAPTAGSTTPKAKVGLAWSDEDDLAITTTYGYQFALPSRTEWTQVYASLPATTILSSTGKPAAFGRLTITVADLPTNATYYVDDVSVLNVSTPTVPPAVLDQYLFEVQLP